MQEIDLQLLLQEVLQEYFPDKKLKFRIRWEELGELGWACLNPDQKLILVNQQLKNWKGAPPLPEDLIQFLVYHEILHEIYPPIEKKGRIYGHHSQFKKAEKLFKGFAAIKAWDKAESITRTSASYIKFGTSEYQKAFIGKTGSTTKVHSSYFHMYGEPGHRWSILGLDPARHKYYLQAISLQTNEVNWFFIKDCVWE